MFDPVILPNVAKKAHYKGLRNNVNDKWIRDPGLRHLNIATSFMFMSAAANGLDGSLINGLQAVPRCMYYFEPYHHVVTLLIIVLFCGLAPILTTSIVNSNLGSITSSDLGLIVGGISLGGVVSFLPASYAADWFGRRLTVGFGSSLMVVASLIQTFTNGPWVFLGTRIMIGVGLAFAQTAAAPLTTEIAHPKHRGQITALFQATWLWGSIVAAAVTLSTLYANNSWAWRAPCLVQALFPGLQIVGLFFVPESPRWLISKGRTDEALQILARYHANGDQTDELVQFEFQEICTIIEAEKVTAGSTGWMAFLQTKGNRRRLLLCVLVGFMIQWAGNGVASYYLAPILKTVGITSAVIQAVINLCLQIWNAIFACAGAMAAEKFGRRPLWMISTAGMLGSFIIITALSTVFEKHGNKAAGNATVALLFVYFAFYVIAFTPLSIAYPVEILPFHLRAKGLAINQTTAFAAGFFNQYVNPIALAALAALAWKFYFVYIACLICLLPIIYFLFPETKGRTLEEIALVFDGESANFGSGDIFGHVGGTSEVDLGGRNRLFCMLRRRSEQSSLSEMQGIAAHSFNIFTKIYAGASLFR